MILASPSVIGKYIEDIFTSMQIGAIVKLDKNQEVTESRQFQIGPIDQWSVHVAELIGILYAINLVYKIAYS